MRKPRHLILTLCIPLLAACETVTSTSQVGQEPSSLVAREWSGDWHDQDSAMRLEVLDASQGVVRIAYEEDGKAEEMTLYLREAGDWTFFNVLQSDVDEENAAQPGADERYFWGRVVNDNNRLIAWGPDPEKFVKLVERGVLPGQVHEGSVVLGKLGAEHYRIITSGSEGVLMDWAAPLVVFRTKPDPQENVTAHEQIR